MLDPSKLIKKLVKKEGIEITIEIFEKITTMLGAGMGLVVALAWNAAIRALFDKLFSQPTANLIAQFVYAIFLTIIVALAMYYISRIFRIIKNLEENQDEELKEQRRSSEHG